MIIAVSQDKKVVAFVNMMYVASSGNYWVIRTKDSIFAQYYDERKACDVLLNFIASVKCGEDFFYFD